MSRRPEEDSGSYEAAGSYDSQEWQEFTPWRPGDPSTADEAPATYDAREHGQPGQRRAPERSSRAAAAGRRRQKQDQPADERRGRWWTEDAARRYAAGDKVRNRGAVGGAAFGHVPDHTRGRVVSTREGLLGGTFATVEFDNGYTEEVKTERLERRDWLD